MTSLLDFSEQELFSSTFKYAPIGMGLVSIEGKWLQVNSSLCRICGYSESELLGAPAQNITHPADSPTSKEIISHFIDGKLDNFQTERRYIHKNGFSVWVRLVLSAVRDENGHPLFFIAQIQDITESKITAKELITKTEQLESFIQHNADAIWMVNTEDTVLNVNPAFEQMFGWKAEEITGKRLPLIPQFLKVSMHHIHGRIKAGETVVSLETIRQRKDGQLLNVEATLSPLRDHCGAIIGITGICRNITPRKQAEKELKTKTAQLESFIHHNADAIWMINTDDIVMEVNPAFEMLFGWSANEIRGKKLPLVPDSLKISMDQIHRIIKSGETVIGLETIRQRKDGQQLDVEATLSPLRDNTGTIIGITGICRNITPRKQAEEKLKAKTTQMESFIKHNADPILMFNSDGKVQRVNEAFEQVFGWSKKEIIGMNIRNLPIIPDEAYEDMIQNYEMVSKGQSIIGVETVRKRKNGEIIHVIVSGSPILDGKGNQNGWSVTLRDITEWKLAQEHMRNSEKLSVAGQLAAGIAHEIRNPITSIKGFVQLMKAGFGEKQKYFEIMTSEIERIELILSELLILAKPQTIKYERKDIRVLLSQVMTLLDSQANLNNVQFITEFKPGATHLYCDENQLKQVFINFIKNSIESMTKGGKITIQVESDQKQELSIRLTDEGCGIPKDVLAKLGQPFYTTKSTGTGLGFMVSKKIIENHAGHIAIESEVDKGTSIEIKMPLHYEGA
ncbi:PAS domain S-box protein [Paenibacillus silvisoli]|uniref:PAS domain S-box protein n=1 Tax=Paenibacillus silvisoli TaxID=3110539 RepID=UPI0028054D69|nr:PAS domain S-box protein [Paenibacillus silvisoli]